MIGVIAGMAGAGTWAYFSDTETSVSNGFTAGTLGLKLADPNETAADGVTQTWSAGPIAPGAAPTSAWVDLTNDGNIAANHVEINFAIGNVNVVTPIEISAIDDADITDSIDVTTMTYGTTAVTNLLLQTTTGTFDNAALEAADTDNDSIIQLDELNNVNLNDLVPVPTPSSAQAQRFTMAIQLQAGTGNGNQGDDATLTLTFTLNQDASQ